VSGSDVSEPFWEAAYRDKEAPSVFGSPSDEIRTVGAKLRTGGTVLDVGCGDGRNTLFLLERGLHVTAVDVSGSAIEKLLARAGKHREHLSTCVGDVREFPLAGFYDLVVAHGLLHLMPRRDWTRVLKALQQHTGPLGYNVVAVFTDALPPPADLAPFMLGLFSEGELLEQYAEWEVELHDAYVLHDEHPGGVRHRHPVNKIVARKRA
jgi:tellurite methyltransferase